MGTKEYTPTRCWCWSNIKGAPLNATKNSLTLEEIETFLKEHNAVVCYKGQFYDSVYDVPFVQEYSTSFTYCFATGSISVAPTIDLVPKGTTIHWYSHGSGCFVYPEGTI